MSSIEEQAVEILLARSRAIWGDTVTMPEDLPVRLSVVVGDIARAVRDANETGRELDEAEIAKELGNLILSCTRWADDLGFSVIWCVEEAAKAQQAYVNRRGGEQGGG